MKKLIICFSIAFISFSVQAQKTSDSHAGHNHDAAVVSNSEVANPSTTKVPDVLIVNEEVHDFGKIPQGKPVTYDFVVTNSGNTPLKINNVQASCGCTTPSWNHDNSIEPGANDKINVGFNAHAEGVFNKAVTITYNDNQTKTILIKGDVWKTPASSAPENTGLGEIKN